MTSRQRAHGARNVNPRTLCMLTSGHSPHSYRLLREAQTLTDNGWDVSIIAPGHKLAFPPYVHAEALPKGRRAIDRLRRLLAMMRLPQSLRASVVVTHELDSLLAALWLRRRWKCVVIFDCHEFHAESIAGHWVNRPALRRMVEWIVSRVEGWMSRAGGHVITVNEILASRFRALGCDTVVAPNYPRRGDYNELPVDQAFETLAEGRTVALYVGKLSRDRGIHRLIDLMPRLAEDVPEILLFLLGKPASPSVGEGIVERIEELGVSSHVIVRGPVDQTGVRAALRVADIGVSLLLPVNRRFHLSEPMKVFEYAAAGLPILASDLKSQARLVASMGNGIVVDPDNDSAVVEAVRRLSRDAQLRHRLGTGGREVFRRQYCWEAVEPDLVEFIHRSARLHCGDQEAEL